MIRQMLFSFSIAVAIALFPVADALAHGEPVISVQPSVVAAGEQITVTGSEMEPGEEFAISLESASASIPLGEVIVTGEGEEGNFTAEFTIPPDINPGSYSVVATAEDGDSTSADLEVTAPSEEASSAPAEMVEATGEQHILDRSKGPIELIAAVVFIALTAVGGVWLVRSRE